MLQAAVPERSDLTDDMVWIPGGTFRMGSDHHYADEAQAHHLANPPTHRSDRREEPRSFAVTAQ
jgi:formylglycine-generating enzyme required for sulfatase activity